MMNRLCVSTLVFAFIIGAAACGDAYRRPADTTPAIPAGITTTGTGVLRDVVLVGNNWAGTVTVFDPHTFADCGKDRYRS